ncbi:MAG: DNA polymerase I [Alphaproteobacteria bacterium]|nr:DNA polymerase I [Alphaproteobacteria bacterium]
MTERPTICLVDGSGYIFRAFYALPPMTRADGTPVNAVYGFMNMMMNLLQDNPCSHIVVVFDAKRENFRNQIYPNYKKNRKETPAELIPQFPLIRQAVETLNVPWIEMEGFEADDLIATYTRLAVEQNWGVRIVSADKDLTQLKRDGVSVYDPMKKKEITDEDILKKFGVTPDKIVDVQSLMGDSVDNVPGAQGIGPKTAAELINTFGSLENLLSHLDDIPQAKRREGLIRDREQILISRQLVELNAWAPVKRSLSDFIVQEPEHTRLTDFLQKNGFKSLLSKVQNWEQKRSKTVEQHLIRTIVPHYDLIQDEETLKKWLGQIRDFVSIDTETTGLNPITARLVGFSLGLADGRACYVPLRHGGNEETVDLFSVAQRPQQIPVRRAMALLKPILENPAIIKIGHNIKYDMHILSHEYGPDFTMAPIEDTMVISAVLNGSNHGHGLDELADRYLNHTTIKYEDVCGSGQNKISFADVPLDRACVYAAEDADITFRLYQVFQSRLAMEDSAHIYRDYDCPLIPILFRMEQVGILVDRQRLIQTGHLFAEKLSRLTQTIHTLAGEDFNINSPGQLGVILFEKQGLAGGKKGANGAWTTDVKVLERLAAEGSELAEQVLAYRGFSKLKSTYVDSLLELSKRDPRIHTSFSLTATNTGRLASSDPNLQNIPIRTDDGKEIRRAFIAKPGYQLLAADYSQIELRLMAEVAGVRLLKESFLHQEDIHARTASQIFGVPLEQIDSDTRRRAKAINFGIIYGISAFGLANNLGIDRADAKRYIDAYFEQYPEIRQYMQDTERFAIEHGYVLTPFGRKCFIQGLDNGRTKSFALRAAINAPIQGGAADIIKRAMRRINESLKTAGLDCTLLLQVHDELVFEVADRDVSAASNLIKQAMESIVSLSIPLIAEVGIGHNWKDAH